MKFHRVVKNHKRRAVLIIKLCGPTWARDHLLFLFDRDQRRDNV